ncbi:ArsR/SmtB family transcription factor [Promicromonospora thailandica]|uniref:DNA-binding transcriptional regulator, ArsR family n=1 Tax=Promicromonospora thailandica TaxID=765201 RepID=A0A9X2G2S8_9MICO|nr:helix-turn-helix domain-containing protein [Promicromonospora thailandica]MCP2266035.1 DNA-binding transcriptional regulator, ArsR family [Promicromonospora thailandica]BFF21370.1 winged helix-turn-helix domain-containing protein [Promicromonospora thailandica]
MTTNESPAQDPRLDLGAVLRALSDEHRRAVMTELAADRSDPERTCNSFDLPISKQTQTHHFRTLRDAGLIEEINYGNRKGISLRRDAVDARFPGLLDLLAAEHERTHRQPVDASATR